MDGVSLPSLLNAAHTGEAIHLEERVNLPQLDSSSILGSNLAMTAVNMAKNRVKKVEEEVVVKKKKKKRHEDDDYEAPVNPDSASESDSDEEKGANSDSDSDTEQTSLLTYDKKDAPVIPPRLQNKGFVLPTDDRMLHKWFRILSPRETKGIDGPYNEEELKLMYKMGDINDNTMLWCEGQQDWEQLLFMKNLRPRMILIPIMPPSLGEEMQAEVYNPITAVPDKLDAINAKPLETMPMSLNCSRCGANAIGHMMGIGENQVDLVGLRKSAPMKNQLASQVIPGLLWVGSSAAAKLNPILDQGFTLIINCTSNMGNPKEKLPYFRCRTCPMVDKPKGTPAADTMDKLLDMLEKTYDWIELERIAPERAIQSDPQQIQQSILEKTDKFGRVFKTVEEKAIKLRIGKDKRTPRILLWSRKGMDRPCIVAAAYMIRQYGMPLEKVMVLLDIARPGMLMCRYYKNVLEVWARKYTLGELLCLDCLNIAKENHSHLTQNEKLIDNAALMNENNQKLPEEDQTAVQILSGYLDMVPSASEATKITKALGNVEAYLPKIYKGNTLQSGWTGLLDLNLYGTGLGDVMITDLFDAFLMTAVCKKLRSIGLGSTRCGSLGVKAIRRALCAFDDDVNDMFNIAQTSVEEGSISTSKSVENVNIEEGSIGEMSQLTAADAPLPEEYPPATAAAVEHNYNNIPNNPNKIIALKERVLALGSSFTGAADELLALDLSNNKIDRAGCVDLAEICRQVQSIITLNVSYNPFTDEGAKILIDSITPASLDFMDDESVVPATAGAGVGVGATQNDKVGDKRCNNSITSIDLSCCELGHASSEKLLDTFRENSILNTFIIDFNTDLTAKDMKHMMNAVRSYSKCIQTLSLADIPHSVKTMGYITRLLENWENNIMTLNLTKCSLAVPHMKIMCSYIPKSKVLQKLILSSNDNLGDEGAVLLAESIRVYTPEEIEQKRLIRRQDRLDDGESLRAIEADEEEEKIEEENARRVGRSRTDGPPLVYVDFTHMDLPPVGSAELLKAVCTRKTIITCKLSGNNFYDNIDGVVPWLEAAHLETLHLNACKLGTKGCITILNILQGDSGSSSVLGNHLLQLDLSGNEMHDQASGAIAAVLKENMKIQVLDLGFNMLTDAISLQMKNAYNVLSNSRVEKKLYDLHVNVAGNKCDTYMLGEPGKGRSKMNYRFGVNPSIGDGINDGYSHVNQTSRTHNFHRMHAYHEGILSKHNLLKPISHIN